MATLNVRDIMKRNNIENLYKMISTGSFKVQKEESLYYPSLNFIRINKKEIKKPILDQISAYFNNYKPGDKFEIKLKSKNWVNLTKIFKDKNFGGVSGKSSGLGSERQELGLINAINDSVSKQSELKIHGVKGKIIQAKKMEGLSSLKQEPYIDVVLVSSQKKQLGISCKGTSAPSLAGGGLAGMEVIAPEFIDQVFEKVIKELKKSYKHGNIINKKYLPDYYIKIPNKYIKLLLMGNKIMGGPIDYMYVGPMDVSFSINKNKFKPNGNFYDINSYIKKVGTLYVRVRKRDIDSSGDIEINFDKNPRTKRAKIFVSPKTGKNNLRFVIIDKVPGTGIKL